MTVYEGKFEFTYEVMEPNVHFLQVDGSQGSFPFVVEGGILEVEIFKDSLVASRATGTISNDDFMKYKKETQVYITSLNSIGNDLQQATILNDTLLVQDLREQYEDVRVQIQDYELNFIKSAPNSFISILILERFLASKISQMKKQRAF